MTASHLTAPGSWLSATIRSFPSKPQRRRRSLPLRISTVLFDIALSSTLSSALRSPLSAHSPGGSQGGAHRALTVIPTRGVMSGPISSDVANCVASLTWPSDREAVRSGHTGKGWFFVRQSPVVSVLSLWCGALLTFRRPEGMRRTRKPQMPQGTGAAIFDKRRSRSKVGQQFPRALASNPGRTVQMARTHSIAVTGPCWVNYRANVTGAAGLRL